MSKVYQKVPGVRISRSLFPIGYEKKFDCDMGQIIPIFFKSLVPGDLVRLSQTIVARAPAALAPYMAELNIHTYTFFVPYRILFGQSVADSDGFLHWEINDHDFELFITGGRTGNDVSVSLPRWIPTGNNVVNDNWNGIAAGNPGSNAGDVNVTVADNGKYSLWDYMEMPVGVIPVGAYPMDFPKRAYNMIWNEWFRDENVMSEVDVANSNIVLNACWKKDYFTSALPWQQRGTAPALPVSGVLPVDFSGYAVTSGGIASLSNNVYLMHENNDATKLLLNTNGTTSTAGTPRMSASVNLANAATFDVADLRVAFQLQKWLERNARSGSRYVEFLKSHFSVSPTDDTLQRPMFIGGSKSPIIVSEVLQNSTGGDGVGSLFGHTISADHNKVTKFHANEFGIIMSLMVIRPKASYQQGIDREWLYRTKYDFYFPEFANLSEQGVEIAELYATNSGNVDANGNPVIFGYQGRYNELRSSSDKVCGGLRDQLAYWHMGRIFGSAPVLNGQFLKCNPRKDMFSVTNEPVFIVNVGNNCKAWRPLPAFPEPGLVDHH